MTTMETLSCAHNLSPGHSAAATSKMSVIGSTKWLDAQAEHQAALRTIPSCLTLCDLKNDNYHKLVAAEIPANLVSKSHLKVYKGTTLISEQGLPGIPVAVESLYTEEHEPKVPIIAVAVGPSVLFYRNMKPYFKYTLPGLEVESVEHDVWRKLPTERPENVRSLIASLRSVELSRLTVTSQRLIGMPDEEVQGYINDHRDSPLQRLPTITAMTTLRRTSSDIKAVSCLVIASESGEIFILDSQAFTVLHRARCCSSHGTPCMISVSGHFDIDFRIVVSTREGGVSILRKSWLEGRQIIRLDHPTTGLAILPIDQTIVVVCMNNSLMCYSKKGKRLWSVTLPAHSICMVPVLLSHLGMTLVCVALFGGLVQLYLGKHLVDQFTAPDTVSAMTFGRLGQEDHVLVLVTVDGSLIIKILKRTAEFSPRLIGNEVTGKLSNQSAEDSANAGNLRIPKKTKVFVEQTIRERENASAIYQSFQSELWRLRLTAARATVDVINLAESTLSGDGAFAPIKMSAEVLGLGPVFRLKLRLENMASRRREASNLCVLLHAENRHYTLDRPFARLPPLAPGVPLTIDFKVTVIIDPTDGLPPPDLTPDNSVIRVMIFKCGQAKPLIAATISMPSPELQAFEVY
ncbi:Bardet-Biedl syndrome 1 protein [Phlebotomus argentipes]|uniref:Bardet-Biedl syndrome 1 protein n=1 Tax=Phlebotomus argentipes TaxID=94469 RepID=UPI002892FE95|nr:Bardet-Biedl syndrome 1 protein [Phlebotomus argentipes]